MLGDKTLMAAVSKILQRSERQTDAVKLLETFVDTGILAQLTTETIKYFMVAGAPERPT
jgi:hypothetical protein